MAVGAMNVTVAVTDPPTANVAPIAATSSWTNGAAGAAILDRERRRAGCSSRPTV